MVMPHFSRTGSAVALPKPLSPSDAVAVRRIFSLQHSNHIPDAVRATDALSNPLLKGSILADRFLGRYYRSTVSDLTDWLSTYSDLADAPQIHALLLSKLPRGSAAPPAPEVVSLSPLVRPAPADDPDTDQTDPLAGVTLSRSVTDLACQGRTAQAMRRVQTKGLAPATAAKMQAQLAQVLFTCNDDAAALNVAQNALMATPDADQNGLLWYMGGLAAWRLNMRDVALIMFQGGAEASINTPYLRAANAFWASRAWRARGDARQTLYWLQHAAEERSTFHGLIARRVLRMDIGLVPGGDLLTQGDIDAVGATPAGQRAFALLQVDEDDKAEAELRTLWPDIQRNPVFGRSVLLVASAGGLTDFAAQLASLLQGSDGRLDTLRYPLPRLQPTGGFRVDKALVYALARAESNFDPAAVSPAGARGLMQIMPATASYLAGGAAHRLHEPGVNLDIGQRYVRYLAGLGGIGNDLIRVLASYNSGPGTFQRWAATVRDKGDPLLFIEAIPITETRNFVPEVLAATWIYAARMHEPIPSLDSLAEDEFPAFNTPPRGDLMSASATVH